MCSYKHYFFSKRAHVLMPKRVYAGQKLKIDVAIGTMPMKPKYASGLSNTKRSDKRPSPIITLKHLSTVPIFFFINSIPFFNF